MSRETKIKIADILTLLGVILECVGIYKLAESVLGGVVIKGLGFVIVGFLIGVPSAVARQYFRFSHDTFMDKDRIAVETLAKLTETKHTDKKHAPAAAVGQKRPPKKP